MNGTNGTNGTSGTSVTVSGTTNYVVKFTSASTIGNSNITDSGTLVSSAVNTSITGSLQAGDASVLGAVSFGDTPTTIIGKTTGAILDLRNTNTVIAAGDLAGSIQYTVKDDTTAGYCVSKIDTITLPFIILFDGTLLKIGPLAYHDKERYPTGPWCKKGDWVIFARYAGSRLPIEGGEVRLLNDDEVLGTIKNPEDVPYTVMHEQKELFSWSVSRTKELGFDPKDGFMQDRKKIMDLFRRESRYYDFGPTPSIWNCSVWKTLEEEYCKPNNLTFTNLIEFSPSELSWYGESLLAFKSIEIYPIEPLFKVFHYPQQYNEYKQQNITEEMIAQNYFGIILQSNWKSPLKF